VSDLDVARPTAMLPRFFGAGARFFLRNLVMLVLTAIFAAICGAVLLPLGRAAVGPLADTQSVQLAWLRLLLPPALVALSTFFFLLVYDYAVIRVVVADDRRPVRTWLAALRFVTSRAIPASSIWVAVWVLLGLVSGAYIAVRHAVPATTGFLILLMVVLQQAFMVVRATLRVAAVSAELQYASGRGFLPAAPGA
jgi:hypothetical protein